VLKIVLVPLTGRLWCMVCPIPGPGEWLQRRAIVAIQPAIVAIQPAILVKRGGKPLTLAKKWPRKLSNVWLQNGSLLAVMVFSPIILTLPLATGIILLIFIGLAIALSLVFERRVFCRYVCPLGGFIGLYSLVAPLELRVKDTDVCRAHRGKECYLGSAEGYGCPWLVRPWRLRRNAACGLCTECLKTCTEDNVAVNLKPFGADLLVQAGRGLDEAYTALIALASALLFSAIFLGPWGWLKDWAGTSPLPERALYAGAFLAFNVVLLPGLFLLAAALSRGLSGVRGVSLKQWFTNQAYALVPLGLSLWIAFSLTFLLVNGSYALSVLSDPFGWGWDLFGSRSLPWTPYLPGALPYLQIATVIGGLVASIAVAYRLGRQQGADAGQAVRGLIPIALFLAAVSVVFLLLYLG
jgi:hypothetical protein